MQRQRRFYIVRKKRQRGKKIVRERNREREKERERETEREREGKTKRETEKEREKQSVTGLLSARSQTANKV